MEFPISYIQAKSEELRQRLVECINVESTRFIPLAEAFYAASHRKEEDYRQLCEVIITATERILSTENWEESLFLRNTLKPIKKIHEEACALREQLGVSGGAITLSPRMTGSEIKLYIALYQSNGHDLKGWALQLASLSHHLVGRPIYYEESDVGQVIRLKASQLSEAYVIVAVSRSKIVSGELVRKDRLGKPLVNVLPGAVKVENIIEFVHQGKRYSYLNKTQELLLQSHGTD